MGSVARITGRILGHNRDKAIKILVVIALKYGRTKTTKTTI